MRPIIIAIVTACALVASVAAGPRKVLVLPVDGNAPAAQRSSINSAVVKLAKSGIDGDVTAGDTTFADTAAAVGCNPDQPTCAETVLTTLSVDEVVWGTANVENGSTTVTIHRAAKGEPARQQIAVIDANAGGDQASTGLEPMFTRESPSPGSGSGSEVGSGSAAASVRGHTPSFFDTKERKIGFGLAAGSVGALVIGFSLWAGQSSLQDQIDNHPTMTVAQLQDLHNLEDRASTKAIWGNVFVALGIGLGGASTYYFWKDHKNRNAPVVAPAPTEDGTGVKLTIGGRW